MRWMVLVLTIVLCFGLTSCGKSTKQKVQENEMKSKSEVRMKILDQYNACIKKADGDKAKVEECESLLKASEKVK
ncbi:hypothetical protein N9089_02280 [Crocinitomicaceae bacterium]|jgi:hypothetical protein|nr:hypothetical protein [Crocinitomicaceae bacterium]